MREIRDDVARWSRDNRRVAIARVVAVDGSGPRDPGAAMAVAETGEVAGSVSGGCVESSVVVEAGDVLAGRHEPRVVSFGYSDDDAFAVGLTCGGTVHVFTEVVDEAHLEVLGAVGDEEPVALGTAVAGPGATGKLVLRGDGSDSGTLGDDGLDRVVTRDLGAILEAGGATLRHYGTHGEARDDTVQVFLEAFVPPARLVILGAVDFTAALARAGKLLGYRVIVSDPREVFATEQRFPMADRVVVDWPDRLLASLEPPLGPRDAVCVLTHDAKFVVPAITAALSSDVGYLGAMGSRRTHAQRLARLREAGVTEEQLERLMAPIGLDLGARTPEEVAVSICAEMIAVRTGSDASFLRDTDGPIHT